MGGIGQPKFVCAGSRLCLEHVTVTKPGVRSLWHRDLEVGRNVTVGRLGAFDRELIREVPPRDLLGSVNVLLARSSAMLQVGQDYLVERDQLLTNILAAKKEIETLCA